MTPPIGHGLAHLDDMAPSGAVDEGSLAAMLGARALDVPVIRPWQAEVVLFHYDEPLQYLIALEGLSYLCSVVDYVDCPSLPPVVPHGAAPGNTRPARLRLTCVVRLTDAERAAFLASAVGIATVWQTVPLAQRFFLIEADDASMSGIFHAQPVALPSAWLPFLNHGEHLRAEVPRG